MKPRNLYRIVIGILMLISGMVTFLLTAGDGIIGSVLVTAGLVFLITGILRHHRFGDDAESDERSKKIGAYGITYAWLTGIFFLFTLFWLDYFNIFVLTVQNSLILSILVLTLSAVIYQTWLFRKGDVD